MVGLALISNRYCNEDEENDPGEEFEEILNCVACSDMGKWAELDNLLFLVPVADMISVPAAHRQCARDANTLSLDDGRSLLRIKCLGASIY
jgi:hypothetical protein